MLLVPKSIRKKTADRKKEVVFVTGQITVTGMVLSTMPIGDYDKRLSILTLQKGRISVFVRGAKRPNSPFLGCSQPFCFGDFTLYQSRSSYYVAKAEIQNYFGELRSGLEQVSYGLYFCELAEVMTEEENDAKSILKLLYQSLRALSKGTIPAVLIRRIYELKLLYLEGQGPQVFECVHCKATNDLKAFSIRRGGMLCETCAKTEAAAQKIKESTRYTLQFICTTPIEKLYCFTLKEDIRKEFSSLVETYRREYVEYKLKSLDMIELLEREQEVT